MKIIAGARNRRPVGSSNLVIDGDSGKPFWKLVVPKSAQPKKKANLTPHRLTNCLVAQAAKTDDRAGFAQLGHALS
jgi:hypothetical protein